ncbi:MAG: hypothetical protein U1C57_00005, partial [Candidatus Doudnabacteria bacterium]|nr:hypothetical protein [Candidatus Doudnabacteria bacterium]
MTTSKKSILIVLGAGLIATAASFAFVGAAGPQFNIFPISYTGEANHDLPLLDARNATKGESWSASAADFAAGIQADPGDVIEFSIYYHNGVPDTEENVARNTIIKAFSSPGLGTSAAVHGVSAMISADNAAPVASDNPWSTGGNAEIRINSEQGLTLVPGSVVLRRDQGSNPQTINLPDTIFTTGVNIGDVRGCF